VDKTLIWGAHTQYVAALGSEGWRVGLVATGNRLSHPKIPNYRIQNIPRDPGTTWAANLGVGVARAIGGFSFGAEYINEPMRSETWGLAERDTAMAGGGVLRAGDRTVTNHFSFTNSRVRVGVGRDFAVSDSGDKLGFQFGLMVYAIDYSLHQTNHVQQNDRWLGEGWTEVSPTMGLQWRGKDFALQYAYRLTCGPRSCTMGDKITIPPATTGGVIAAPSSPLTTSAGSSSTHRFLLSVPIR